MKRTLAAVGATAALFAGLISVAPEASATSNCTMRYPWNRNNHIAWLPAASDGSTSCLLAKGSSGDAVYALQYALRECSGLDTGGFDGVYGDKTVAAVRTLQSWYGLPQDGVYGPNTRNWVMWSWFQAEQNDTYCAHL
jgi:murein L,D-transpeptidase YcbB/YkuD